MTGTQPLTKSPPASPPLHTDAQGVQLRAVTKKYGTFTAVENITLDIPAGSYCCLLGPSGCGKTTTLRMLAGHETVTSGDIFIGAERVTTQPPAQRNTAMVFQNYALFPHKTVWDNVGFGLKMRGVRERDRAPVITEMLALVGMEAFAHRKPTQLSGGQQQRVALARALANRPQVLLLDEPLSALDESLRIKTRSELRRLQKQFGMTFIQVTHAQDEAFSLSDVIVVMDHGRVDQVGSGIEIYTRPASTFVAQFVGDNNIFRGRVIESEADVGGDRIRLDVPDLGPVQCIGHAIPNGQTAACCIRADQLQISDRPQPAPHPNHLTARIVAVEFTGYITRITLLQETNGQELLYKAQTEAWLATDYQEGQVVTLSWAAADCIFLPH